MGVDPDIVQILAVFDGLASYQITTVNDVLVVGLGAVIKENVLSVVISLVN